MAKKDKLILWFSEIKIGDLALVGGKNASLGEMYNKLSKEGINIPNGFTITATAYRYFLKFNHLEKPIKQILRGIDTHQVKDSAERGQQIRQLILAGNYPADLEKEILLAYKKLGSASVAVRSSATAEDLPGASFAGQQESFLNVVGKNNVLLACKRCFASLFTDRAISYRVDKGFPHQRVALSVGIQKMVRSDLASSGVMFTLDTDSGFKDVVMVDAAWGLGENVVKGRISPDEYLYFKKTGAIISKELGTKEKTLIYAKRFGLTGATINVATPKEKRLSFVLKDKEISQLAKWGEMIERHYQMPMDIEWAKDGLNNKLYIVQARPETVESAKDPNIFEEYYLTHKSKAILSGLAIGSKIGQGRVHVIRNVKEISHFKPGEVLVTTNTDPDWEPVMKVAAAIITDQGGRTSHAAIVSRELDIPCIVGTKNATRKLKNQDKVTVSCSEGEKGNVYSGLLPFKVRKINLKKLKHPKTKIMMNLGNPQLAFTDCQIPNDGVGLARLEFIFSNYIKIHPLALLNYYKIKNPHLRNRIDQITAGYKSKREYFVDRLAYGVARLAAGFYPKTVIVRTSDFKTNEYATMVGGKLYEPAEENPMIGWRGASRYYSENYRVAFELECQAIKKVREEMGLTNVIVMIPFCRTVEEGQKVIKIMEQNGLKRGQQGLQIYVMCEIPSNVILAKEFAKIFDGFSIGSNDLTQLVLGLDRDSTLVSAVGNERNEAVKIMIRQVIKEAHRAGRKIGICGQAPSDFPDFAKFLVKEGIDSLSLTPDSILKTWQAVSKIR